MIDKDIVDVFFDWHLYYNDFIVTKLKKQPHPQEYKHSLVKVSQNRDPKLGTLLRRDFLSDKTDLNANYHNCLVTAYENQRLQIDTVLLWHVQVISFNVIKTILKGFLCRNLAKLRGQWTDIWTKEETIKSIESGSKCTWWSITKYMLYWLMIALRVSTPLKWFLNQSHTDNPSNGGIF